MRHDPPLHAKSPKGERSDTFRHRYRRLSRQTSAVTLYLTRPIPPATRWMMACVPVAVIFACQRRAIFGFLSNLNAREAF